VALKPLRSDDSQVVVARESVIGILKERIAG